MNRAPRGAFGWKRLAELTVALAAFAFSLRLNYWAGRFAD